MALTTSYSLTGENCKVKDPKSGYEYNLTPLAGKDYEVKGLHYEYHFAVCGPVATAVCPHGADKPVSSCQVEEKSHRIAGGFLDCHCRTDQLNIIDDHFFTLMSFKICM